MHAAAAPGLLPLLLPLPTARCRCWRGWAASALRTLTHQLLLLPVPAWQIIMKATMPGTMGRVLGGFRRTLDQTDRLPVCHLADQPQASRGVGHAQGHAAAAAELLPLSAGV